MRINVKDPNFPEEKLQYYQKLQAKYIESRITREIAEEYESRAKGKTLDELYTLREEMKEKYNVTDVQAINILHGFHIGDYVRLYQDYSEGYFYLKPKKSGKKKNSDLLPSTY